MNLGSLMYWKQFGLNFNESELMINNPLLSIIIPSFNREYLIGETLDSISSQTYQNWECLVIDDGSTDDTVKIIENYIKRDKRIKVSRRDREPKGAPTCRNIGLDKAKGDFLLFLDSDDILFNNALNNRLQFILANPDLDFCVASGLRGQYPINATYDYHFISNFRSKHVLPQFFNFTVPWVNLNPIYRHNSLINSGVRWTESMKAYQDVDFHIKCILAGLKFDYCNHLPDCLWREHNQGNIGSNELDTSINIVRRQLDFLKKVQDYLNLSVEDVLPIYSQFIRLYVYSDVPTEYTSPVFTYLYKNRMERYVFKMLFSTYRWLVRQDIKKVKGLFFRIIIQLKQGKYLREMENEHFLIYTYQFDER